MNNIFNTYTTSQGIPFVNISKSVTFPQDETLGIYQTIYNDEDTPWTVMSYLIYGKIDYWWILSALNKNYPFYAPREMTIRIISPNYISKIIKYIR